MLFQLRNMWDTSHQLGRLLEAEPKHPLQAPQFSINGAIRRSLLLTLHDVRLDSLRRDTGRAHLPEKRLQMAHVLFHTPYRFSFIDLVVLFHKCREILEADTLNLWPPIQS